MIQATVLADSVGADAPRLTTFELVYPRFIHAEVMTHRVFSRNASSSRAIPTSRMLDAIERDPARPVDWRMNQPGMQGFEVAGTAVQIEATRIWDAAMREAVKFARELDETGVHKQFVNRLTEPFQHIRVVLTGTDFDNWFGLRDHPDAEPHIQILARLMREAQQGSVPKNLQAGEWHLPYITEEDIIYLTEWFANTNNQDNFQIFNFANLLCRISAARCARVSYKTHEGKTTSAEGDLKLFDRLVGAAPIHASPTEHQASPDFWLARNKRWMSPHRHGNLRGWCQFRKDLPYENLQQFPEPEPVEVAE